jgi:hypothetical protein
VVVSDTPRQQQIRAKINTLFEGVKPYNKSELNNASQIGVNVLWREVMLAKWRAHQKNKVRNARRLR